MSELWLGRQSKGSEQKRQEAVPGTRNARTAAAMAGLESEAADLPRSAWERLIDEWIFLERDRAILKRRLLDGLTYERLAAEFDMSVRQTKNIVYKAQNRLFSKLH